MREAERSTIYEVTVDLVFHTALLVSLYFLFAGHNRPGGGFIGGLVAGGAVVLRWLAGRPERTLLERLDGRVLMGAGVALASATAIAPLLWGYPLLDGRRFDFHLPVFGTVKLYSVLFFDTGVFLVVVGMVLAELDVLGSHTPDDSGQDSDGSAGRSASDGAVEHPAGVAPAPVDEVAG